jgi:hypothetical protein
MQLPVKQQLYYEASLFVIGPGPDTGSESPCSSIDAFNLSEAASVQICKMLPVNSVLVEPLNTYR